MTSMPVLVLLAVCALCIAWSAFVSFALATARRTVGVAQKMADYNERRCQELEADNEFLRLNAASMNKVARVKRNTVSVSKATPGMRADAPDMPYLIEEEEFAI